MEKYTNLTNEIEHYQGNDWLGMTLAVVVGLAVAIIIVELLFGDVLHYWLADMIV